MKVHNYETAGTCSEVIRITEEDGVIKHVEFRGGCNGNLQGISRLVEGAKISEIIPRVRGIRCGNKSTSCPDQLAKALENIEKMSETGN